jgi:hypothetical protein
MISTAFDVVVAWVMLLIRRLVVELSRSSVFKIVADAVDGDGVVAEIGYASPLFNPEPIYGLALLSAAATAYTIST